MFVRRKSSTDTIGRKPSAPSLLKTLPNLNWQNNIPLLQTIVDNLSEDENINNIRFIKCILCAEFFLILHKAAKKAKKPIFGIIELINCTYNEPEAEKLTGKLVSTTKYLIIKEMDLSSSGINSIIHSSKRISIPIDFFLQTSKNSTISSKSVIKIINGHFSNIKLYFPEYEDKFYQKLGRELNAIGETDRSTLENKKIEIGYLSLSNFYSLFTSSHRLIRSSSSNNVVNFPIKSLIIQLSSNIITSEELELLFESTISFILCSDFKLFHLVSSTKFYQYYKPSSLFYDAIKNTKIRSLQLPSIPHNILVNVAKSVLENCYILCLKIGIETIKFDLDILSSKFIHTYAEIEETTSSSILNHLMLGSITVNTYLYHNQCEYQEDKKSLNLRETQLSGVYIDHGLFKKLAHLYPNLEELDLSNNSITNVQHTITYFKNLKKLLLIGNDITVITNKIVEMEKLEVLSITGNESFSDIKTHYQNRILEFEVNSQKVAIKTIMTGVSGCGKSTLVNQLATYAKRNNIIHNQKHRSDSLEISQFISFQSSGKCIYHFYDFYAAPHLEACQLFYITPRSDDTLFLIVFSLIQIDMIHTNLAGWLNNIKTKCSTANVILIGTFYDQSNEETIIELNKCLTQQISVWEKRFGDGGKLIFRRCPFKTLNGSEVSLLFWPINATEDTGIDKMMLSIREFSSARIRPIPKKYSIFSNHICNLDHSFPIIGLPKYKEFAKDYNIIGEDIDYSLKLLEGWGDILYFPEAGIILFKPEWFQELYNALYECRLRSDGETGIVLIPEVQNKWKSMGIDYHYFDFLWGILEQLNLTIALKENEILIPSFASRFMMQSSVKEKRKSYHSIPNSISNNNMRSTSMHRLDQTSSVSLNEKSEKSNVSAPKLIIARHIQFDFLMPSLFHGLIKALINQINQSPHHEIVDRFIWRMSIRLVIKNTSNLESFNDLTYQQISLRLSSKKYEGSGLFVRFIPLIIMGQASESLHVRQLFCMSHYIIDNYLRDKFPQLHENHITEFVAIECEKHPGFICDCKFNRFGTREQCVKMYFHEGKHSVQVNNNNKNVLMYNLIPEVLDPTLITKTLSDIAGGVYEEDDLRDMKIVGNGKSGSVYRAIWNNSIVAVKQFNAEAIDEFVIRDFCQELCVLSKLEHPNIVSVKQFYTAPKLSIIMEYIDKGNLQSGLDKLKKEGTLISWHLLIKISLDISRALVYLHSQKPPVMHNDLKPDNVMVVDLSPTALVAVKLVDFGFAISAVNAKHQKHVIDGFRDIRSYGTMMDRIVSDYVVAIAEDSDNAIEKKISKEYQEMLAECREGTAKMNQVEYSLLKFMNQLGGNSQEEENQSDRLQSMLIEASEFGSIESVVRLLKKGASWKSIDGTYNVASRIAQLLVSKSDQKNLEVLVQLDMDIFNYGNQNDYTPLMEAAKCGNISLINWFLAKGANPNMCSKEGNSILHYAALSSNPTCIEIFFQLGCYINCLNHEKFTPLDTLVEFASSQNKLKKSTANLREIDEDEETHYDICIAYILDLGGSFGKFFPLKYDRFNVVRLALKKSVLNKIMNDPFTSFDYKLLLNSMKPREFQRAYNLMKSMATSFKGKTHPFFSVDKYILSEKEGQIIVTNESNCKAKIKFVNVPSGVIFPDNEIIIPPNKSTPLNYHIDSVDIADSVIIFTTEEVRLLPKIHFRLHLPIFLAIDLTK